jgi:hypothetical protein
MNIKHEHYGLVKDVVEDWPDFIGNERMSNQGWIKDGARYLADEGWELDYQPLPSGTIPDIELERNKRDRAERLQSSVWPSMYQKKGH